MGFALENQGISDRFISQYIKCLTCLTHTDPAVQLQSRC